MVYTHALWIAALPFSLWAAPSQHVFHTRFEPEDLAPCAKAVSRILKPYRVKDSGIRLQNETKPGSGDFTDIEFAQGRHFSLPALVGNPLMRKKRPDGPDDYVPNCLGAALGWFGIHNPWYNFDGDQFESLVKTHFTKVRSKMYLNEETLVVWRFSDSGAPFHAAIYFPDHYVWHRPGSNPAVFTTLEKAINSYGGRYGGSRDALVEFYRLN